MAGAQALNWLGKLHRFGGVASVPVDDTSTPTTVGETAALARLIVLTGTLTAQRTIKLPPEAGADWTIVNGTTGGHSVRVRVSDAGNSVDVEPLEAARVIAYSESVVLREGLDVYGNAYALGSRLDAKNVTPGTSYELAEVAYLDTYDATVSTIYTITPPNNGFVDVDAKLFATDEDSSNGYRVACEASFNVQGGGITQASTTLVEKARGAGVTAGMTATIDASAGVIRVRVTGRAGEWWRWGAKVAYRVRKGAA